MDNSKTNHYEMAVDHYFSAPVRFTVEAASKADAMKVARKHPVMTNDSGNLRKDSLRVARKINKKQMEGKR